MASLPPRYPLIIAEKQSSAKKIAQALDAHYREEADHYETVKGLIVWTNGHLYEAQEPGQIDERWQQWQLSELPIFPKQIPLQLRSPQASKLSETIKKIAGNPKLDGIIAATDPGREGQLIFDQLMANLDWPKSKLAKNCWRLWLLSLDATGIQEAFATIQQNEHYRALSLAAQTRATADWLLGLNLSRYYSLHLGDALPVGRVQTPTLMQVYQRELASHEHKDECFLEFYAQTQDQRPELEFQLLKSTPDELDLWTRWSRRQELGRFALATPLPKMQVDFKIAKISRKELVRPAPLFFNLLDLQVLANQQYGYSAQKTLDLCQSLYHDHNILSYPRTDVRSIPSSQLASSKSLAKFLIERLYPDYLEQMRELPSRCTSDAADLEHHALIPVSSDNASLLQTWEALPKDAKAIFDLIVRRFLQTFFGDKQSQMTLIQLADHSSSKTQWLSCQETVEEAGYTLLAANKSANEHENLYLERKLKEGQTLHLEAPIAKEVHKPRPHAMSEAELLKSMQDLGLGTAATRSSIIESLKQSQYITQKGNVLRLSEKALRLLQYAHVKLRDPELTASWEQKFAQKDLQSEKLLEETRHLIGEILRSMPQVDVKVQLFKTAPTLTNPPPSTAAEKKRHFTKAQAKAVLLERFQLSTFRQHQEQISLAVANGQDVLLVMPTGSGKSLCYQLPAALLGGTALVISPLISLMQNQVSQLRDKKFRAAHLHAGLNREESRNICKQYRDGELDFLYIAPERLRLKSFADFLTRHPPSMIAIDEAHCVSGWGHDFRPDYRLIGQTLRQFPNLPRIALTATAGESVQKDIIEKLELRQPLQLAAGFRRSNIAIEVDYTEDNKKIPVILKIAEDKTRLPMIVYAATRKKSDEIAAAFSTSVRVAAYHAGMQAADRGNIVQAFLGDQIDVIVATVAFGMGIDKANIRTVVHHSLPSSAENYYQEIGRAGRDAKLSRAILLYSWEDWRIQDFLINKSYPAAKDLKTLLQHMPSEASLPSLVHFDTLRTATKWEPEHLELVLGKLRGLDLINQAGMQVSLIPELSKSDIKDRLADYANQIERRHAALRFMDLYTRSRDCRMAAIVKYFTDDPTQSQACGICDTCFPNYSSLGLRAPLNDKDQKKCRQILETLDDYGEIAKGKLSKSLSPAINLQELDALLACLEQYDLIEISREKFTKNEHIIHFQKIRLRNGKNQPTFNHLMQSPAKIARIYASPLRQRAST